MFRLEPAGSIDGTSRIDEVDVAPAFLVEQFGAPSPFDHFKVSGQYRFVNEAGDVFTVYDYKVTSLYLDAPDAPSPEAFWARRDPHELGVGGRGEEDGGAATRFVAWLLTEYRRWRDQV